MSEAAGCRHAWDRKHSLALPREAPISTQQVTRKAAERALNESRGL